MAKSFLIFTCREIDSATEALLRDSLEEVGGQFPGAIVEEPDIRVDQAAGITVVGLRVDLDVEELFSFRHHCSAALERRGLLLMGT